jgi:short-subunit dehydrogenase
VDPAGRTALLTGATGGLGRAIAAALAARGATLVLSSRKAEELAQMAAELPGEGHSAVPTDLAEPGAALELAAAAGEPDILVANAGLPGTGRIEHFSPNEVERALRVNLEAPMLLANALLPGMLERRAGHLVFVASLSGKAPSPRSAVYNATKFGLRGFSLGLRTDLRGSGVGSSIVAPGFIRDAGMFADARAKAPPGLGTSTPAEVGAAVVRAIERDSVEVAVAPAQQRVLAHVALAAPRLATRSASGGTAQKAAHEVASGQTDKR